MATVVSISYDRLLDPAADLTNELVEGFGPNGLGIITISGVPSFTALRRHLLPLAQQFANLADDVKQTLEHEASSYNVGWSHGKEALRSGRKDIYKGSFYANPLQDTYNVDQQTADRYKAYYSENLWPRDALPELETAFKQLGTLIVSVGLKLAGHCSRYVQQQLANATGEPLDAKQQRLLDFAGQLRSSCCHKARLLHYFPVDHSVEQAASPADQDWCGWHLDHGALTGLTSAMYIKEGQEVPNPDPSAGLYICDRSGNIVQAAIPADHIAYQMGQVMAIQSGGLLRATPHYVRAAAAGPGISRNTFAVFMQPDTSMELETPRGAECLGSLLCLDSGHWTPGMTFGEFADLTMQGYYHQDVQRAATAAGGQESSTKDVAPAAVHAAAAAANRSFKGVSLLVSHE